MWHRRHHEIFTKSIAPLLIAIAAAIGIGIGICWAATQAATAPKPETKSAEARRAPCAAARGNGHCRRFAAHSRFRDRYRFLDRRRDRRAQIRVRRERREGEAPAPAESTADANGVYEVRIDPDTFDAIVCSAPGYTRQRNPLDTAGHVEIRMDFQLVRGGTVSGHVTDKSTGAPVEGIGIELAGAQENIFERMRGRQNDPGRGARSQQDGSYVLDGVPAGSYRAILSMRGTGYLYKPEDAVPIEIAAGKTYDNIDFTVERGAEITGRVSNAQSGDPIAGASVVAMPAQMIQRTMRRMGSGVTMDLGPNDTRTDEQGEFKLTGLDFDSEYRAIAQADGLASGASEAIQLDHEGRSASISRLPAALHLRLARYRRGACHALELLFGSQRRLEHIHGPARHAPATTAHSDRKRVEGAYWLAEGVSAAVLSAAPPAYKARRPKSDRRGHRYHRHRNRVAKRRRTPMTRYGGSIKSTVLGDDGSPAADVRVEARQSAILAAATAQQAGGWRVRTRGLRGPCSISVNSEQGIAKQAPFRRGKRHAASHTPGVPQRTSWTAQAIPFRAVPFASPIWMT